MRNFLMGSLIAILFGISARECNAQIWPINGPLPCGTCGAKPPLLNMQVTFWYKGLNAADTLTFEYRQINPATFLPMGNGAWLSTPMFPSSSPPPFPMYTAHWADIPGGVPAGGLWQWQIKRGAAVVFGPTYFFS